MKPMSSLASPKPWYRHGMVWLLIAGPALVIVAGVITAAIAMRSPDPVLANDAYEFGQKTDDSAQRSLLPAQKARNHAATPVDAPIK